MRQSKRTLDENAFSILTVDDDPILTSTVQAYFQRSGYRVDEENDPRRAIERVRQGNYDILLLDFLMSPLCGDQVVEQIRAFNKDIYIILLTGHKSMAPPIKTIRALDIQGYYEKSDRFDQLEMLVESCAKSIRQMRTIRNYKEGLSTIVESLPRIHTLSSANHIADNILRTAFSLLPCLDVSLVLDQRTDLSASADTTDFWSVNGSLSTPSAQERKLLFEALAGKSSLTLDNRLILPIEDNVQSCFGLLTILCKEPPKPDQVQMLEVFARQSSSAICNARLHTLLQEKNHEVNRINEQLEDNYLQMVSTIRCVVDAKDAYTRGHSDRVSYYAAKLARHLGRDEEFCRLVQVAGLFHDVGKLYIPDEILLKPTRLSPEEYAVIKSHATRGYELLSAVTQFRAVLPVIRSHHEHIDGTGYPDGLRGSEISEAARIIAVADTFDAMTSDRQYRKARTLQETLDELMRVRGTQLDADFVDAFLILIQDREFWKTMGTDLAECMPNQIVEDIARFVQEDDR